MLAELGQRGYVVPRPHPTLVTRRVLVMERLSGFNFDDVAGMQRRRHRHRGRSSAPAMIAFMEGAMIHGIFHGDLHGGNLFVLPDGRTALLDFGIVGRLDDAGATGVPAADARGDDQRREGPAGRAARPRRAARRHRPRRRDQDLRLDQPPVDPTTLTGDELVKEVQRVVKALLGYGARMPKELMLYVKNMVFLDGAIARLAPDLDLLGRDRQHLDVLRPDATASGSGGSSASTTRRWRSTSTG